MFLKPTEPQSIASQLVLLFTLAAAVLLCCGLVVFYLLVVHHAFEEDNRYLIDKLVAVRADLSTTDWPAALNAELRNAQGREPAYWIRVVNGRGETLTETPNMAQVLPPNLFQLSNSKSAIGPPVNHRAGGKLFSLLATQTQVHDQTYVVHVAQDRTADEGFTRRFGALLALVLALGIVASVFIGRTVARRGLRPLNDMTEAVQRVGPSHLDERIAPERWPRELRPLAAAFDGMLNRLEDSFRRLSQFSADLAHELRTPVANLLGEAQVTLNRNRTPEEYRQVIESSVAECERLSGIIDNLLFLARADAAKDQVNRSPFDARAAAENISGFYQAIAEERQITIHCSGRGEISADETLFRRALSNLIENALRFTPAGGMIQIEISASPNDCHVSVTDSGSGIPREHLPHVFDRFYRVDSSRTSGGAGLGLALVKSIVELHGGSVEIQSEESRGTRVTLNFPNRSSRA
jgi:two-component system heavy metal sensor histidine kinase CusS